MIGKFDAKITDYGVSEAKSNGNPQVFITLSFEHEGAPKTLTWYGSFAGGGKDITLKTLIYCGLQPQHYGQLVNLVNGVSSGMLDLNKPLTIDVAEEPKIDGSGNRTVVNWINDPATAPGPKKIGMAKNASFFGQMQFDGDLMRLAGEMGLPLNNGAQATMGSPAQFQNQNPHNQQMNTMGGQQWGQQQGNQFAQDAAQHQQQNQGQFTQQNAANGSAQTAFPSNNQNVQNGAFKAPF